MSKLSRSRRPLAKAALTLGLALMTALPAAGVALAQGVTGVDPHTGKRVYLPDNNHDGRADYVPRRLEIQVVPGINTAPNPPPVRDDSAGGTICHGRDGGTTISTARRVCDPDAPSGDGGPGASSTTTRSTTTTTTTTTRSTPTRPSSGSSTRVD
ncbi:hypothetical protein [Salinicola sp. DM10]|uniref:hypothetical protein n=1 Tax=Salinicola sp. DM10 TaxID=2815721 RepID=UPI0004E671A0|nr:hypothetical protein [Salinicola sp. DM10]KFF47460.1 hypothetical protein GY26_19920 [Gammaproteobacteria bacterium MFB021]MCE3026998.1 hypothetical protein [Salinicola sp. DM10]